MIGDYALFFVGDDFVLAFQTADDSVDGGEEILFRNEFLVVAGSDKSRFVANIGDIGTREPGGLARQERTVELRVELQRPQMDIENLLALLDIGQTDLDLAVETSGAHQRLVENIGTVRRSQDNDARIGLEAVHLGKQLIERVFALVVARESGVLAAGPPDGIDFIDKKRCRVLSA